MNQGFKQRLVGAVVLVCLALILWPVLFSDNTGPVMDRTSQIPPMPEFEKYEVPQPIRPEQVIPVKEPEIESEPPKDQVPPPPEQKVAQPEAPAKPAASPKPAVSPKPKTAVKPSSKTVEKPTLNEQNLPQGWVLQVASFSQEQNARELQTELQAMGYKAFTRPVTTTQGKAVRVYVGPKFNKLGFEKERAVIDKKYKVKSIVVPFQQ